MLRAHLRRASTSNALSLVSSTLRRTTQRPHSAITGSSPRCFSQQTIATPHFSAAESLSHGSLGLRRVPQVPYGFRELDIRESIAQAIEKAFPNVQRPTIAQAEFIPAILNGKDVLLHDETGTGKSFGSIVALLNKRRTIPSSSGTRQKGLCITSLVIVPHRDLGFQMMHWIESILNHSGTGQPPLDVIAQLVVRSDSISTEEQTRKLRATPPHILIGTPQALWDIYRSDQQTLQLNDIATIVVDEVDYLLDVPPPYVRQSREGAAWKNFNKHPSPARQLLEAILPLRKSGAVPLAEIDYNDDDDKTKKRTRVKKTTDSRPLQIVMSSATVHSNLTDHLCDARWLSADRLILSGKQLVKANAHMVSDDSSEKSGIVHHAFVVSPNGSLANAEFSVRPGEEDKPEPKEDDEQKSLKYREKLESTENVPPQSPTSPVVMEAVATMFALDIPRLALLVLPPGSSVKKVIPELRELGVNARMFDMRSGEINQLGRAVGQVEAEPTLLVATPATVRGVDLPQLTHVFCAGVPDVGNADVFKHIAGRVGRFGRSGKVITIVTEREQEYKEGVLRITKNPAGLLKTFYRKLRVKPIWFDLSAVDMSINE